MQPIGSPVRVIGSWQLDIAANALIGLTFFTVAVLIMLPLWRMRQVRTNTLAVAAAAVFFCAGVGRAAQALHLSAPLFAGGVTAPVGRLPSWQAGWDAVTAVIAITYLVMRKRQARLLDSAPLFDDLAHVQHVSELAALRAQRAARAEAEAERDASAAMLKSIIANSQSAIYVKDLQGRFLMANPPLLEILGKPEEEVLGQLDPASVDAPSWGMRAGSAEAGSYRTEESRDGFPDGRHFYDSIQFPLRDAQGVLYATCGVSLDVTKQTRAIAAAAEDRDLAVAAAAAKSTFLATVSHEIRTPLNAVIGLTEILRETDLDSTQHELVDTVRSSGEALLAIIEDILDFSTIESGSLRLQSAPFALRETVETCLDPVAGTARAKGLELVCHVDKSCPDLVVGDASRLRQIIANVLSNAVKFTEQGEVFLSVTASPTPDARWLITIRVSDTGIGIGSGGLARVFSSFSQGDASSTRRHGGAGLGLAITQSLANAMGGEANVVSTPGVGTAVTVTTVLEAGTESVEGRQTGGESQAENLRGRSVLLVDDNPTSLRVLAVQLAGLGMRCTATATASEALRLCADGRVFDVALLGEELPDMGGPELSAALRDTAGGRSAPHVLLTKTGRHRDDAAAAYVDVLNKPVKLAALRSVLRRALAAQDDEATEPHAPSQVSRDERQPLRILLAEDNPVNQRVAQLILRKLGHDVDIVGDGSEAVHAVRSREYDVVLMDVQMPRMDGLEATRLIRADGRGHQPSIVAVTASAYVEDRDACIASGMDGYLSKPMRAGELEGVLADISERLDRAGSTSWSAADTAAPTPEGDLDVSNPDKADARAKATKADGHADSPAIDLAVFDALIAELDDADGTLRQEVILTYLADTSKQLAALLAAARDRDTATAASIAHIVRSTSALIGTRQLAELLQHTEASARTDPARLANMTQLVMAEYARVTTAIHELHPELPFALHPEAVPTTRPAAGDQGLTQRSRAGWRSARPEQ